MNIYDPIRTCLPPSDSLTTFRFPSPSSDYFKQTAPSTTKLSNPRAQLLERWQRVADQIASKRISWDVVIALNRNLDTAETIFSSRAPLDESWKARLEDCGLSISNMADSESDVPFISNPKPQVANAPEDTETEEVDGERRMPHTDEALLARFTQAVAQLRKRQRGYKHLHDMATQKSENEAKKIYQLRTQVDELEKDIADDESELSYLKLQLRIIEIQTLPYVPKDDQDSLAAGIQRWKLDWAEVDKRYRKRRWKREIEKKQVYKPGLSLETEAD
ncbi:hypothetical protein MMC29_004126 [Sticta canariensis]|nr:hypothetical protein [Sticta canariensis]